MAARWARRAFSNTPHRTRTDYKVTCFDGSPNSGRSPNSRALTDPFSVEDLASCGWGCGLEPDARRSPVDWGPSEPGDHYSQHRLEELRQLPVRVRDCLPSGVGIRQQLLRQLWQTAVRKSACCLR